MPGCRGQETPHRAASAPDVVAVPDGPQDGRDGRGGNDGEDADPMTCEADRLASLTPAFTALGGRPTHEGR
jgi:hypothetical protein